MLGRISVDQPIVLPHEQRVQRGERDVVVDPVVAGDKQRIGRGPESVTRQQVFGVAIDLVAGKELGEVQESD